MIGLCAASNAERRYQILMQFHPHRVARVHSWPSDPGVLALFDSCEGSREAGVVSPEPYEVPAELLAERALTVLDTAVPFDDGALFGVDESTLLFNRLLAWGLATPLVAAVAYGLIAAARGGF